MKLKIFLKKLKNEFKITVTSADSFLGMQIVQRNHGSILINQGFYAIKVLDKFGTSEA